MNRQRSSLLVPVVVTMLAAGLIILLAMRIDSGEHSEVRPMAAEDANLLGTVLISEVVTSNPGLILDDDGDASDWIELHNPTDHTIDLHGWTIGRNSNQRSPWIFPTTTLAPHSRLVLFASGKNRTDPERPLHTDFALARTGTTLWLSPPRSGQLSDRLEIPAVPRGASYGRGPATDESPLGDRCFFARPQPGAPPGRCHHDATLGAPEASHPTGFYDGDILVTLYPTGSDPNEPIHYTLDGSTPDPATNPRTLLYSGPIRITSTPTSPPQLIDIDSVIPADYFTSSWARPAHVVRGTPQQGTVLRARTTDSADMTATYFVGADLPRSTLPVVSVVIDPADLIDPQHGIHVTGNLLTDYLASPDYDPNARWRQVPSNFRATGTEWRRPSVDDHRTAVFHICEPSTPCSEPTRVRINIHGNASRLSPLKTLRLHADDNPWEPRFPDEIFGPDTPTHRRILLRNSGNDYRGTMLLDGYLQSLMSHFAAETQAYRPAVVFVNGEYWGVMNLRERYDQHYLAAVHGLDPELAVVVGRFHEVERGDPSEGPALRDLIQWIATSDPNSTDYIARITAQIDIDSFFDFLIGHLFAGNLDWPGNNVRAWRNSVEPQATGGPLDGRWRWMIFDLDLAGAGLRLDPTYDPFTDRMRPGQNPESHDGYPAMFHQMMANPILRTRFLNRAADHLSTTFTPSRTLPVLERTAQQIAPEMERHLDRWGPHATLDGWLEMMERLRTFMFERPDAHLRDLTALFELEPAVSVNIQTTGPGRVQVNNLALHPDTPGIADPDDWTGKYWPGVPITLRANPSPGAIFLGWELPNGGRHEADELIVDPAMIPRVRALFTP